jgi:glutamate carboxypeptidase
VRPLLDYCESQRSWTVETIRTLAALESPTGDKAAVDRCGAELARLITSIGGRVDRLGRERAGDHLIAEFGCGRSQVLLLGHFDTVWPVGQIERMPVVEREGRLYGPGTFDMKAGIAIALTAARALVELGPPSGLRIVTMWTSDEETGSATSRAAIDDEARRSEAVLVLEPALPGGALKTARKGGGEYRLVVRGRAAHAGVDPSRGASAVHELARQIVRLQQLQDPARGVSINVGLISGGSRSNVVAEHAEAIVDVRVTSRDDAQRIGSAFAALRAETPGTVVEVEGGLDRPALERTPAVVRLYDMARRIAHELGRELGEGATGGGSDGNYTAALGVPTLDGLGAIGDGAHALHEHVQIADLPWRAALVAGLIQRIAASYHSPEG